MMKPNLASLFEEYPGQWGLRGDPYLWKEMKEKIRFYKDIDSADDFEKLLHDLFSELTNSTLENDSNIYIEKYSHGGMSSGHVSPEFWLERGIPLLVQRFIESKGGST